MKSLLEIDKESVWHPFSPLVGARDPILIESGAGVYIKTPDGRKIIDGVSSWWVNLHGHSNPFIADAISRQASKLEHVIFAGFTHEPAITLTSRLLEILPGNLSKMFFSDNGSTAVEVAIKLAIQYFSNISEKRNRIIVLEGAYHGDTFGSMSVGARSIFSKPFDDFLFSVDVIPLPKEENKEEVLSHVKELVGGGDVIGMIYEPLVQGASGMRMYSAQVLDEILDLVRASGGLLLADEVFTGFGRTGKLFASEYLRNAPDIIAVSKGITGGALPLGVTGVSKKVVDAFLSDKSDKTFFHGHSYTANPIACAAANASLDLLLKEECLDQIKLISTAHQEFVSKQKDHKAILDIRSLGTILAIDLKVDDHGSYLSTIRDLAYDFFLERNVLLRPLGNTIYFLPPYVISKEELRVVYALIEEFLVSL
jgi:adenosylmethionine-8-amino-7-oxononanoate aminotransferase